MAAARVSRAEHGAIAVRQGNQFADNYKKMTEQIWLLNSIGLAILMSRLSYRIARLQAKTNQLSMPDSPYFRIGALLRECHPRIRSAAENYNKIALALTPEKAWSEETTKFMENSARVIALSYPS